MEVRLPSSQSNALGNSHLGLPLVGSFPKQCFGKPRASTHQPHLAQKCSLCFGTFATKSMITLNNKGEYTAACAEAIILWSWAASLGPGVGRMGVRDVIFWIWAPLQQTWAECVAGLMFLVSGRPGTRCGQNGCHPQHRQEAAPWPVRAVA